MSLDMLLIIIALVIGYLIGRRGIRALVQRIGREKQIPESRVMYVTAVLSLLWTLAAVVISGVMVGISYDQFGIFFSSVFAVIGVALFAQWSMLSNITASVIVFFFFPYRVGDWVRVADGDNSIEGIITDITLFHVILRDDNGDIATFPNALTFQKAVLIRKNPIAKEETLNDE